MEVKIANDILEVTISSKGAELSSVKKDGKELIWQADPNIWGAHGPTLFPICGGLKDDKFIYNGKSYTLQKHGFSKMSEFEVENASENCVTFLLKSNEETRKSYPFDFELRITYTLSKNELVISYDVKNMTDGDMYFSIGAHESYVCPNGIEEYSIIFDKEEDFEATVLEETCLSYDKNTISKSGRELPLKYEYFAIDALAFLNLKSRNITLKNNITGEMRHLNFEGFPYFLIWTKPNAKYICLEPWCGIPDFVDSDFDITKKVGILRLGKDEKMTKVHKIRY